MSLSLDDVKRVANLARIELCEEEVDTALTAAVEHLQPDRADAGCGCVSNNPRCPTLRM